MPPDAPSQPPPATPAAPPPGLPTGTPPGARPDRLPRTDHPPVPPVPPEQPTVTPAGARQAAQPPGPTAQAEAAPTSGTHRTDPQAARRRTVPRASSAAHAGMPRAGRQAAAREAGDALSFPGCLCKRALARVVDRPEVAWSSDFLRAMGRILRGKQDKYGMSQPCAEIVGPAAGWRAVSGMCPTRSDGSAGAGR